MQKCLKELLKGLRSWLVAVCSAAQFLFSLFFFLTVFSCCKPKYLEGYELIIFTNESIGHLSSNEVSMQNCVEKKVAMIESFVLERLR